MRLGLSQVSRKLKKKLSAIEGNENGRKDVTYFLDEEGNIVAKEVAGQIVQVFVETEEGKTKLLVLVKGLKRKVDQNLRIISAALVFGYEPGAFIRFVKSRSFCYEKDVNLEDTGVRTIAKIKENGNSLLVTSDFLGVTETLDEVDYLENTHPYFIISEKTKTLDQKKKE